MGQNDPPEWSPNPGFRWIPSGTPVRYSGCQVGIELSPVEQIAPLLLTIRRKLLLWSTAKLSFAGRILVVNQVLLATMWYILSCWVFSKSCINQIQRAIRCFLWSGKDNDSSRAKVAWAVISLPKAQGGLGIIDPVNQSRALLAKLVVRGLQPGIRKWKHLLRYRMALCSPIIGGLWQPNIRWIFNKPLNIRQCRSWENNFINGIWRAWSPIRLGLRLEELASNEELQRQPLTWNPRFTIVLGHMLGTQA